MSASGPDVWAKVDDGWWAHPKVMGLSMPARGLWITALSWSCAQRRDVVPTHFVTMVCNNGDDDSAGELVDVGLWEPNVEANGKQTGWRIHDWDQYQERTLSEKRADAGRKGGLASGRTRSTVEANGKQTEVGSEANGEAGTRPVPSRPDQTRPDPPKNKPSPDGEWPQTVTDLTREFAQLLLNNGHTLPAKSSSAATRWLVEMDRLRRIGPPGDGQGPVEDDEIRQVMQFALVEDPFWLGNIRSVPAFREKYTQLRAKMRASPSRRGQSESDRARQMLRDAQARQQ